MGLDLPARAGYLILQSCRGNNIGCADEAYPPSVECSPLSPDDMIQEVLPGTLAVRGESGKQCAVCESCKRLVYNDLL